MTVFFANRANLQSKRLHDRIQTKLSDQFDTVYRRRTDPTEPGSYRVVSEVNPRHVLADTEYPVATGRIEIGFQLRTSDPYEYYWINWVEPDRSVLVGWHQDDTHEDLGPVHLQVNDGPTVVDRIQAPFIDTHPLDVIETRLNSLQEVVVAVEWAQERPSGLNTSLLSDHPQR